MSDDYKKDYLDADLIDLKDKFGDKEDLFNHFVI